MKLPPRSEIKKQNTESPIEELLYYRLLSIGLNPETQFKVGNYRIDIAFPEKMLAIECDGRQYHNTPEKIAKDKERQKFLESQGWKVMRYSGSDIFKYAEMIVSEIIGKDSKWRTVKRDKSMDWQENKYDDKYPESWDEDDRDFLPMLSGYETPEQLEIKKEIFRRRI